MTFNERIAQLRAFALTAKTAIYNEDAMTAIELAGCTAAKVNECIDVINGALDLIEQIPGVGSLKYDPDNEEIVI